MPTLAAVLFHTKVNVVNCYVVARVAVNFWWLHTHSSKNKAYFKSLLLEMDKLYISTIGENITSFALRCAMNLTSVAGPINYPILLPILTLHPVLGMVNR